MRPGSRPGASLGRPERRGVPHPVTGAEMSPAACYDAAAAMLADGEAALLVALDRAAAAHPRCAAMIDRARRESARLKQSPPQRAGGESDPDQSPSR